jgi:hypothetical protein
MTDPLTAATRALREVAPASPETVRGTRTRILTDLRERRRRRFTRWALGLPLAAILVGSVAWAAANPRARQWTLRVVDEVRARHPVSERFQSLTAERGGKVRGSVAALGSALGSAELGRVEGGWLGVGALAPTAVPLPSAAPTDAPTTIRELELYAVAHRAHFVDKDPARALGAWDAYLAEVSRPRFLWEARYNRALCLVRLGRRAQAEQALGPFASGAAGGYRRAQARRLLESLQSTAPEKDAGVTESQE